MFNGLQFVIKKLPHPPCEVKVEVTCIGGHETVDMPCHTSKSLSCGRFCGRRLQCGNHTCQLECHTVSDLTSQKVTSIMNNHSKVISKPLVVGIYYSKIRIVRRARRDASTNVQKDVCIRARKPVTWDHAPNVA